MADNTGPSKSNDLNNVLPRGLLGRKGLPIGQGARLPSLGRPRDLTLGGSTRRTYAPNIPVRKERGDAQVNAERGSGRGVTTRGNRGDRGRGGGRGRGVRVRGGGRGRGMFQETASIFSEGIALKDIKKTSSGESSRSASDYIPRPKVDFKKDIRIDKEQDKQTLRAILQDDFIDDDDNYDEDSKDFPITLPLCPHIANKKTKSVLKRETKVKSNDKKEKIDTSIDCSGDKISTGSDALHGFVKIKSEPLELDDDQELNDSSMVTPNVSSKIKKEDDDDDYDNDESRTTSDSYDANDLRCSKLLLSINEMEQDELVLFQFSDCLPLSHLSNEDEKPIIKQEPGIAPDSQKAGGSAPSVKTVISEEAKSSSLSDISEGHIGKLQILKSGKTRLVIGNVIMNVEMGTDVGYLQDVVSLRTSGNSGSLTVLGHPRNRLICVPDMINIHG